MRTLVLFFLLASSVSAGRIVSSDLIYSTMADVGPYSGNGEWCITDKGSSRNDVATIKEFTDGLGCGQTAVRSEPLEVGPQSTWYTSSGVDNRVGSTGTSSRSVADGRFWNDEFDSWSFWQKTDFSAGSVQDEGVPIEAELSAISVVIIGTDVGVDLTGRDVVLSISANAHHHAPDIDSDVSARYAVWNHTTGDMLFSVDWSGEQNMSETVRLDWNDNVGDELRFEFLSEGDFSGVAPSNRSVTGLRQRASFTGSAAMFVPEPSGILTSLFGFLGLLGWRRR